MASLATWRPTRNLFEIHRDMDGVFDNFLGRRFFSRPAEHRNWVPPVDIVDADDHVEIRVEVPGLTEKDVNVSITDHVLTLKGEKQNESEVEDGSYHRVERSYGHFQRSFTLPTNLQTDQTKAAFKNGVLTISVPKTEQAKPKEIPIDAE